MTTPQQPELARAKRSPAAESSAKLRATSSPPADTGAVGAVPEDNLPGHHPPVEQDKPRRRPSLPPRHHRFRFRRDQPVAAASIPFGVNGDNAYVDLDDERLEIRFGPWTLTTAVDNIEGAERTGPYQWWKVAGPPHLSLKDLGVTFATTAAEGVCIRFKEPVPALLPKGLLKHKAVTVTIEDPDDLVRFVAA